MGLIDGKQINLGTVTGRVIQSLENEIAVDISTVSAVFTPLVSIPIVTVPGSRLYVTFRSSSSVSVILASTQFRLLIDGVPIRSFGVALLLPNIAQAGSITRLVTGLAPGPHTVSVEWKTDPGNTAFIRPVTAPDSEEGGLVLLEIS